MATKTAVIVLHDKEILIWAIPPLLPQPPDFFDHHPTHIPPLLIIPLPVDIKIDPNFSKWNTISSWYFGSSQPLYCDLLGPGSTIHRFQIVIEPDLSTASLHVINTPEITPYDFTKVYLPAYMICEDTLVSYFIISNYNRDTRQYQYQTSLYTGLTTANGIISHSGPAANMLLSDIGPGFGPRCSLFPCPASGRFVLQVDSGDSDSITVLDFF